jgi:hypothetical protein
MSHELLLFAAEYAKGDKRKEICNMLLQMDANQSDMRQLRAYMINFAFSRLIDMIDNQYLIDLAKQCFDKVHTGDYAENLESRVTDAMNLLNYADDEKHFACASALLCVFVPSQDRLSYLAEAYDNFLPYGGKEIRILVDYLREALIKIVK